MVVFFVKSNQNTYPKGGALMQMYRVVPLIKRGNTCSSLLDNKNLWPLKVPFNTIKTHVTLTHLLKI